MKRRLIFGLVIALLTVNFLIGARVYSKSADNTQKDSVYPNLRLFSEVMEKVRRDYVDGTNLTYQDLVYGALKGMINTLDPHSEFMDKDKYKELQSETEGHFGGLGIVISLKDNYVTVSAPMEDTPGSRAGILSGDRIVKIDGKSAENMTLTEAEKHLRGEPGTDVTITIFRPSIGVTNFTLTRAVINVDMAIDINGKKEFPVGENKIGYVRLVQFGEKASSDLDTALKKLKQQGMQIVSNVYPHVWPYWLSYAADSPFLDIRVRKAANLAIDREGLCQFLGGLAKPVAPPPPIDLPEIITVRDLAINFVAIILEAVPFMMIGALIGGIIEAFA